MTDTKQNKKTERPKTAGPKPFIYDLLLFLAWLLLKLLYGIQFVRDARIEETDGPYFIIGNHTSYIDPAFCALAISNHRIRFVTGQEVANTKWLRPLFKHLGIIEIKPFHVNFSSTREIISSIADGHSVALYPETQRSMAGGLTPFGSATAKLIKHLKAPVAAVVCRGAYLGWPRWAKGLRPGKIVVETHLLFTRDEIASMSIDDIQRRLVHAVHVDDY
ncbi:MAG TPA: lysophospholipid acyltransferase family protein, partial [Clostridia bacterium]|nr:lysophospholipid acyltransferase family protein [Clostridia bacterium]